MWGTGIVNELFEMTALKPVPHCDHCGGSLLLDADHDLRCILCGRSKADQPQLVDPLKLRLELKRGGFH